MARNGCQGLGSCARLEIRLPVRAMTLEAGFMMAESADIGRLMGLVASARSMMTTWLVSPTFSRTQMYLSDSMVRLLKPMLAALMPTLVSCKVKWTG